MGDANKLFCPNTDGTIPTKDLSSSAGRGTLTLTVFTLTLTAVAAVAHTL